MEYSNAELVAIVERYKAETGIYLDALNTAGHAFFVGWLLRQKLQQTHVMPSLLDFKARRLKAGLTLREVEKLTGISNAYLSQLENKKIDKPSFKIVQKLNDVYASNGA